MGHTELDESLAVKKGGFEFGGPVMLTAAIDPNGTAHKALSQFAFGAIELATGTPVSYTHAAKVIERFSAGVVPATATSYLRCSIDEIDAAGVFGLPLLVDERVVVEGDDPAVILERTRTLRQELGADALIAAGGCVDEPSQAIELRQAGADLIVVGEGLARGWPELGQADQRRSYCSATTPPVRWDVGSIFATLYGLGIIVAAGIAISLALTTVILAYDEEFVGLTRSQLDGVHPHLLQFMKHDRLSYAGATLSLGILTFAIAAYGIRRNERWAYHTFLVCGVAGFGTFGLFFLYHYIDVGNVAVAAVLLPFFALAVFFHSPSLERGDGSDIYNDKIWRHGLIGQLLFVALSVGLIVGGTIICTVGGTHVFVVSDLAFLNTTSEQLKMASDRLLPLIAHDRVSSVGPSFAMVWPCFS